MRFLKRPYLGKTNLNLNILDVEKIANYYLSVGLLNFFNQYFFRKGEVGQISNKIQTPLSHNLTYKSDFYIQTENIKHLIVFSDIMSFSASSTLSEFTPSVEEWKFDTIGFRTFLKTQSRRKIFSGGKNIWYVAKSTKVVY
jgi:hypothetical protein